MNIEDLLVLLLIGLIGAAILALGALILRLLRRRLGWDVSVRCIYLYIYPSEPPHLVKLGISGDPRLGARVNHLGLHKVNGKEVISLNTIKPFKLGNEFEEKIIKFDGAVRPGKNKCIVDLAIRDRKGDRGIKKKIVCYAQG